MDGEYFGLLGCRRDVLILVVGSSTCVTDIDLQWRENQTAVILPVL